MNHPFLALLQLALLAACILVELHPRIRTGGIAGSVLGLIAIYLVIYWDTPASLLEYLITALVLVLVVLFARARTLPETPAADPMSGWRITP